MTHLERLIREQVQGSTVARISRSTDTIAEELAAEILKDPEFRARVRRIIAHAFTDTINTLHRPLPTTRRRRRRKPRKP